MGDIHERTGTHCWPHARVVLVTMADAQRQGKKALRTCSPALHLRVEHGVTGHYFGPTRCILNGRC